MAAVPSAVETLLDAVIAADPQRVLVIGTGPVTTAAAEFRARRPAARVRDAENLEDLESAAESRYDVAVVGEVVGVWPEARARQLLAALRDRYARSILLLAPEGAWPLTDYLALGFERRGDPVDGLELLWYDVDRFNPEREWNNPDHWANPENFKRYRW